MTRDELRELAEGLPDHEMLRLAINVGLGFVSCHWQGIDPVSAPDPRRLTVDNPFAHLYIRENRIEGWPACLSEPPKASDSPPPTISRLGFRARVRNYVSRILASVGAMCQTFARRLGPTPSAGT